MARRRVTAGLLSLALPGAGHLYVGARMRGIALLTAATAVALAVVLVVVALQPIAFLDAAVRLEAVVGLLVLNALVLGLRLFGVADAWRLGGKRTPPGVIAVSGLVALVALTAAPHAVTAYYAVRGYETLTVVFAETTPTDVLPADGLFVDTQEPTLATPVGDRPTRRGARPQAPRPTPFRGRERPLSARAGSPSPVHAEAGDWVTILLIGSDHGPERPGHRTDTMIVAALERGTRRAVLVGVPRNFVDVPLLGSTGRHKKRFALPLNALYQYGLEHPSRFPDGANPGATALKQTISLLLGVRVDYYAFVDLNGFVNMVDALGGVRILVKERLVDEVTRPSWGETKPRIDVVPGRTYTFSGRTALAYVRSRKASSDYTRMSRQRCFLSALAGQLNVATVLRHFGSLTAIARRSVRTDIPLDSVPDLVRLVAGVDPRLTVTETFGRLYISSRRRSDNYPRPAVARIRAAVRDAILLEPGELEARRRIQTVARAC